MSGKRTLKRQLKEAHHTIGSSETRGFDKKNFNRLAKDSLFELEEGQNYSNAEATMGTQSTLEGDEQWIRDPKVIGVRHDVEVFGEP